MTHVLSPYAIYMKARRLLKKGNNKNDSNKKEQKTKKLMICHKQIYNALWLHCLTML